MFIDSHAHFDLILENKDISEEELFYELGKNQITRAVQIAIEPQGFQWARDFARKHKHNGILFTTGIHPSTHAREKDLAGQSDFIEDVMGSPDRGLFFGVGECGLDYYRLRQPKDMQMQSFEHQIDLAKKHNMPVIIHSRDAMDDTIALLEKKAPLKGVMHCFPGSPEDAKKIMDLGLYISFAGNVTYKKAETLQDSAQYVPLDRMLIETDAPFLTPVPMRGKKNRPHYVTYTYHFIAELRKEPLNILAEAVRENFNRLCDAL